METDLINEVLEISEELMKYPEQERISLLNKIRTILHSVSPMKNEPVDLVLWIDSKSVGKNDYNPNSVAPPEMKLLETSIREDGYTQPVVAWESEGNIEVVD